MSLDLNVSPYYDDYNVEGSARDKGYVQILAVPGRVAQAREFTQMGSMFLDHIGRLGSSVFKDGEILSGCSFYLTEENGVNYFVLEPGSIYLSGLVRNIGELRVSYEGTDYEYIGVKVIQSIVTENEDSSLRNPDESITNGLAGAHRLKESVVLTCNDNDSATIYTLVDGTVVNSSVSENNYFNDILAKRLFDESGNYTIEGLVLSESSLANNNSIILELSSGRASIEGYEVVKPTTSFITLTKSDTYSNVAEERKYYTSSKSKYQFNQSPVKQVNSLNYTRSISNREMTRSSNQNDFIDDNLEDVVSLSMGSTVYVKNIDFAVLGTDIQWLNSSAPASGTTYNVTYLVTDVLDPSNYRIVYYNTLGEETTDFSDIQYTYLEFVGQTTPIDGTVFTINYDYYLARKDLILMDKQGLISIIEGEPAQLDRLNYNVSFSDRLLPISSVICYPNSSRVELSNYNTVRMTQSDIYALFKQVQQLQYDLSTMDLDKEAEAGEDATSLRGIYTDGFVGYTKSDVTNSAFNCSIDIDNKRMTLPVQKYQEKTLTKDSSGSVIGNIIVNNYNTITGISQRYATGAISINKYLVFGAPGYISIKPSTYNWTDTTYVKLNNEQVSYKYIKNNMSYGTKWEISSTNSVSQTVLNSAEYYVKSTTLEVLGKNFVSLDATKTVKVFLKFNDVYLTFTPKSGYSSGTKTINGESIGYVKADSKGVVEGSFTIPANTFKCGVINVTLVGYDDDNNLVTSATVPFTAKGIKQTVTTSVTKKTVRGVSLDPLAQSFTPTRDMVVLGVELFFAKVSTNANDSVTVQLRNMVNGYPGDICYAECVKRNSELSKPSSTDDPVSTRFTFDQPVLCPSGDSYCFCVLTGSNQYQLRYAVTGGTVNIKTNKGSKVTSNPYGPGVMFSSSNNTTWTAHQDSDLQFNLLIGTFNRTQTITFNTTSFSTAVNRIMLLAQVEDNGCDVKWFCRKGTSDSWSQISPYSYVNLDTKEKTFQIKVVISGNSYTTPFINNDCIKLIGELDYGSAVYVSRAVSFSDSYKGLKIGFDLCIPTINSANQGSFEVYYFSDSADRWVTVCKSSSESVRLTGEEVMDSGSKSGTLSTGFSFSSSKKSGDPVVSYVFESNDLDTIEGTSNDRKTYRIKLILRTSDVTKAPYAKKLMSVFRQN